jgi:hypothetical protein
MHVRLSQTESQHQLGQKRMDNEWWECSDSSGNHWSLFRSDRTSSMLNEDCGVSTDPTLPLKIGKSLLQWSVSSWFSMLTLPQQSDLDRFIASPNTIRSTMTESSENERFARVWDRESINLLCLCQSWSRLFDLFSRNDGETVSADATILIYPVNRINDIRPENPVSDYWISLSENISKPE